MRVDVARSIRISASLNEMLCGRCVERNTSASVDADCRLSLKQTSMQIAYVLCATESGNDVDDTDDVAVGASMRGCLAGSDAYANSTPSLRAVSLCDANVAMGCSIVMCRE